MKKYKVPVQSLIDHIKTAIDVDPWAKEMVEELLKEQEAVVQLTIDDSVSEIMDKHYKRLKEQEAVEPFHKCIGKNFSLIEDSHFDYCPYCGKPITWAKQEGR